MAQYHNRGKDGGDTMPFSAQTPKQPPKKASPKKRRRRRIPQRIYRRGRFRAFLYVTGSLAICVAFAFLFLTAFNDLLAFSKPNQAVEVTIPRGADSKQIGQILEDEGLVKYGALFAIVSEYEGYEGKYQHGAHVLNTNMGYTTMMKAMKEKETVRETVQVTIPEGLSINDIAVLLDEAGVCDGEEFVEKANTNNFGFAFEADIPDDGRVFYKLEGYIFPDTYEFYKDDTPLNVIRKFLQNFDMKITDEMKDLMRKKGLTLHETLTIASIIQGEATGEEMNKVSSVYWNRINDVLTFPKLQADPTRDYANEQILTHLDDRGSVIADYYNTYTSEGLPPGPINNPGSAAIMAALQPDDTPDYYFCTDLRTKVFYYAETLSQHNANVRKAGLRGWS